MVNITFGHTKITPFFVLFLSLLCFSNSLAQTTNVQFKVNMNQQTDQSKFDPTSEYVDIAGSYNNWGSPPTSLNDSDGDGIYSAFVSLTVGSIIEFKARINGEWNGREEFPGGGPNRSYTVEQDGIVDFWYNDELPDSVLQADFNVSSVNIIPGQVVQFFDISNGTPTTWAWSFPGGSPVTSSDQNPVVSYAVEGVYTVSLTVSDDQGTVETKTKSNYIRVGIKETYWWNEAVFYEIFVRSFYDKDGDGKGDFQGIIEKLDYLNDGNPATNSDLGINAIWLMPIQQSPSYHGYDATDYRTVESDYGTNDDFQEFIQEAHKRGIQVIIDYVMNHSSSEHPWFIDSKNASSTKRNWYRWRNTNPGGTGPWGQTVWHYSGGDYYYGLFWQGMPDLNYETPEVKTEMFDIAKYWLQDMDVDGFRLDAVKYIYEVGSVLEDTEETLQFWRDFRAFYKGVKTDAFAVGEAWTTTDIVKKYVENEGLDYCFEFDLSSAILNAVGSGNVSGLTSKLEQVMSAYPFLQFGTFLTNHDMNRVMDVFGGDEIKARQAAQLLLTLPGIPYLYYGEEIGMVGSKPDEDIRLPLQWNGEANAGFTTGTPWRAPKPDYTTKNIAIQQRDNDSHWHTYQQFIALRNNQVALKKGNYNTIALDASKVVAFLRQFEDENIIIVSNVGADAATNLKISLPFAGITPGNYVVVDLLSGNTINFTVDNNGGFMNQDLGILTARSTAIYKLLAAGATSADVLFNVDMRTMMLSNTFDPIDDNVDMVSNLNGFGAQLLPLTDNDGDSIYSISIEAQNIGSTIEYKYRINSGSDGREEFKGSSYLRSYIVQDLNNIVLDDYQFDVISGIRVDGLHELQIYPNPTSKELILELPKSTSNISKLLVHNLSGLVIKQASFSGSRFVIEVSDLQPGIYFVKVFNNNQNVTRKVIIGN